MIKVIFAPGCYGSFLTKCLYNVTDLSSQHNNEIVFDQLGSSHDHWHDQGAATKILWGHLSESDFNGVTDNVVILPDNNRQLEYYVNQFTKAENSNPYQFLLTQFSTKELTDKLAASWGYNGDFKSTPIWILREFLSYGLHDILNSSYNRTYYASVPNVAQIETEQVYTNLYNIVVDIASRVSLQIKTSARHIITAQSNFAVSQLHRNCQYVMDQYVAAVIHNVDYCIPRGQLTFPQEAYIQYKLKESGRELRCNELDSFPINAKELTGLVY